jgi:hypothetical protein
MNNKMITLYNTQLPINKINKNNLVQKSLFLYKNDTILNHTINLNMCDLCNFFQ